MVNRKQSDNTIRSAPLALAIDWRNDGKIRSIVRIGSSPDPDLVFDYDPSGNRLSKKVFNATGQLLYTNYYLRDAQVRNFKDFA